MFNNSSPYEGGRSGEGGGGTTTTPQHQHQHQHQHQQRSNDAGNPFFQTFGNETLTPGRTEMHHHHHQPPSSSHHVGGQQGGGGGSLFTSSPAPAMRATPFGQHESAPPVGTVFQRHPSGVNLGYYEPTARAFFGRHHVLAALEQWEQALQNGDSGEEEAAAALKEILALPEREIAVVSDPRLLHHWTNAGQQPLAAQPHSLRLDPRLRPATPPAPGYAAEEALQALSDQPPLVGYPSPHMERILRPPFEDGEFRIVVAVPPPSWSSPRQSAAPRRGRILPRHPKPDTLAYIQGSLGAACLLCAAGGSSSSESLSESRSPEHRAEMERQQTPCAALVLLRG